MGTAFSLLKQRTEMIQQQINEWESKRNVTVIKIPDN